MSCDQVRLDLVAFLSGELPARTQHEVAAHLSACPSCAEEASAMRETCQRVSSGLQSWVEQGRLPVEVEDQLRLALEAEAGQSVALGRRAGWRTAAIAAGAAAAAMVLAVTTPVGGLVQQAATALLPGARAVGTARPVAEASRHGITVAVPDLQFSADQTVVAITVAGTAGISAQELSSIRLMAGDTPLTPVGSPTVAQADGGLFRITATFGAAPAGVPLSLQVDRVGGVAGPWVLTVPARG